MALFAAKRADIRPAAAALCVIGGCEGEERQCRGEDATRENRSREGAPHPAHGIEGRQKSGKPEKSRAGDQQLRRPHATKRRHDDERRPAEQRHRKEDANEERRARHRNEGERYAREHGIAKHPRRARKRGGMPLTVEEEAFQHEDGGSKERQRDGARDEVPPGR